MVLVYLRISSALLFVYSQAVNVDSWLKVWRVRLGPRFKSSLCDLLGSCASVSSPVFVFCGHIANQPTVQGLDITTSLSGSQFCQLGRAWHGCLIAAGWWGFTGAGGSGMASSTCPGLSWGGWDDRRRNYISFWHSVISHHSTI